MNENQAKKLVESLMELQKMEMPFPCPRCDGPMPSSPLRGALSRRASVYICPSCGMEEALLDMKHLPPKPFVEWAMPLGFSEGQEA